MWDSVYHRCSSCQWVKRQPRINLLHKYLLLLYRTYKQTSAWRFACCWLKKVSLLLGSLCLCLHLWVCVDNNNFLYTSFRGTNAGKRGTTTLTRKYGGCKLLSASRDIKSGCPTTAFLGQATSLLVRPSWGTVRLGLHQQRADINFTMWSRSWNINTPQRWRTSLSLHRSENHTPRWGPSWSGACPPQKQCIRQLLTAEEMADRKPLQFLRHLRSLTLDMPDDFLHTIWSSRLPQNIQAILASQPDSSLDSAARCADCVSEVTPQPALITQQDRFHTTPSHNARSSSANRRSNPKCYCYSTATRGHSTAY
jgi:hypothetical protein